VRAHALDGDAGTGGSGGEAVPTAEVPQAPGPGRRCVGGGRGVGRPDKAKGGGMKRTMKGRRGPHAAQR